jgi:hypothetical protein
MVVRIDDEADGELRDFSNFFEEIRRRLRVLKSIDYRHSVVSDHESGVASRLAFIADYGGPHAVADLLEREIGDGWRGHRQ